MKFDPIKQNTQEWWQHTYDCIAYVINMYIMGHLGIFVMHLKCVSVCNVK